MIARIAVCGILILAVLSIVIYASGKNPACFVFGGRAAVVVPCK